MEQTVKCPICGEPYVFYAFYAGDQSACPSCRQRARDNMKQGDFRDFPRESQQEYFGTKWR